MTQTEKQTISWGETFSLASDTYDHPIRRFFDINADALVREVDVPVDAHVLDVATGTGKVAIAVAERLGPHGSVVGIDLAPGMLEQARRKVRDLPISFLEMDAQGLKFDTATFDVVVCGFAVWFIPDMVAATQEMCRVLRPGGRLGFSTWTKSAFEPMSSITMDILERYGVPKRPMPTEEWMELSQPEHLDVLMEKAGFKERRVVIESTGYTLKGSEDWWIMMWGSSWRGRLSKVSPEAFDRLRNEVLSEVGHLQTAQGIWLDASCLIGVGSKV